MNVLMKALNMIFCFKFRNAFYALNNLSLSMVLYLCDFLKIKPPPTTTKRITAEAGKAIKSNPKFSFEVLEDKF